MHPVLSMQIRLKVVPQVDKIKLLQKELSKVISGYEEEIEKLVIAMLAGPDGGHVLIESVPGLGKTTLLAALQAAIANSKLTRIQMTPDLKPTDIVGTEVYNPKKGVFEVKKGPIHGVNLLLADEINRATPKAQSALLEGMQERKVTLAGQTFYLEDPFLVLATENPIEQEGTYPLPEAQLDRFCFKLVLGYVSEDDEEKMLRNNTVHGRGAQKLITPVITTEEIVALRQEILTNVHVSDAIYKYIVSLVRATRPGDPRHEAVLKLPEGQYLDGKVLVGASPRAQIWIRHAAAVRAYLKGRAYVTPEDVKAVATDVLRHRIILSTEAQLSHLDGGEAVTTDGVIKTILKCVPVVTTADTQAS